MASGRSHSPDVVSSRATLASASGLALTILGVASLLTGGCGASANAHPTARLEGKVKVDGQAIPNGRIQFFPRGSGQPDDAEISGGHYVAERVPSGKVRVTFTAVKETGKMIHEPGHTFPELVSIIPEQYQTGIEIDVGGDNPNQDFNLLSKPSSSNGKGG
jgi:hypothetical protein